MGDLVAAPDDPAHVTRNPLREQIRKVLVDGLLAGRWQPGERIVERRVAAELGVSQAPVREALRELETLRLIESVPNKGARVRAFGVKDMAEIYPVRAGLELVAAELAAPRLASDIRPLECEVEALRRATGSGDVDGQIRHSVEFHRVIVRAARNSVLLHTWESLGVEVWTALSVRWLDMELHAKAADHATITEAFRRRDPAVGRMVRDHVLNYVEAALHTPKATYGAGVGADRPVRHGPDGAREPDEWERSELERAERDRPQRPERQRSERPPAGREPWRAGAKRLASGDGGYS